ncbi:PH domain-containing protein [Micromonospora yangpuensis]|uniref:PH domain-containing protein n=1 Tax=Micromonospora yangpuensis TaxID=683228 RepID=A0A1C6VI02_9ACTN|nr:PH domain-containing protein [Micromonospora yangpuensis]
MPVIKFALAAGLVLLGLLLDNGDQVGLALAGLIAAGLAGWALRDLVAPVRLAMDADGLVVRVGYAGRRRLPWSAIEQIDLDRHSRRGLTTELLEIDAGESLYLFGRYDLNAPPAEVADELRAAWPHPDQPHPGDTPA